MSKLKFSKDANGKRVVVGDKVVALNSGGYVSVKAGNVYKVLKADEDGVYISVEEHEDGLYMFSEEIEVVGKVSGDIKVEEDKGMYTVTDREGNEVKVGDVVTALTDGGFSCIIPYLKYKVDYKLPHGVGIWDEGTRRAWFMTTDEILLVKQEDEIMRLEQNETVAALKEVVSKLDEMLVVLKGTETASELDEEPKPVEMPDWKEGDKVRCIKEAPGYDKGAVYEVGYCGVMSRGSDFGVRKRGGMVLSGGCLTSLDTDYINENILDYFELLEEAQEPEKKGRSVKFKVGDKVRIREGFDEEEHNSGVERGLYFNRDMKFHGVRTIYDLDFEGGYRFEGSRFCYTDNMLELA